MTKYVMLIALVPEDECDQVRFSEGSMHVNIVSGIYGEKSDCAPMLHGVSIDVIDLIKKKEGLSGG